MPSRYLLRGTFCVCLHDVKNHHEQIYCTSVSKTTQKVLY